MKKKFYLSLFLLPFVTGCAAQEEPFDKILNFVKELPTTSISSYSAETEGSAFGNDLTMKDADKVKIHEVDEWIYESSCLFGVPLKLDKDEFYYFIEDDIMHPLCQYSLIKYQLVDVCPSSPSKTPLQSEFLEDGSIKFWATMSNNRLENLGHFVNSDGYDGVDPYTRGPVTVFSGKLDGCYVYDKDGYLLYEEFKTHVQNGPKHLTANARCYYHYYE